MARRLPRSCWIAGCVWLAACMPGASPSTSSTTTTAKADTGASDTGTSDTGPVLSDTGTLATEGTGTTATTGDTAEPEPLDSWPAQGPVVCRTEQAHCMATISDGPIDDYSRIALFNACGQVVYSNYLRASYAVDTLVRRYDSEDRITYSFADGGGSGLFGGGVYDHSEWAYDPTGRVGQLFEDNHFEAASTYTYTYDANGYMIERMEEVDGSTIFATVEETGSEDDVTQSFDEGDDGTVDLVIHETFDGTTRVRATTPGPTETWHYDSAGRLITYDDGSPTNADPDVTIAYDPVSGRVSSFTAHSPGRVPSGMGMPLHVGGANRVYDVTWTCGP